MAVPEQLSGIRNGWRFHVPVLFGIGAGVLLIAATEVLSKSHLIANDVCDAGLVVGGALLGLIALWLDEIYYAGRERERLRREREAERARHQEERRLDFEQYRTLQGELRETRAQMATLQAKLDLTGALDRDRIGDALLLGFYFHRRGEGLPSAPKQSIFKTAALRLKLLTATIAPSRAESRDEVRLDRPALHDVLELAYGRVVAEAFDLGYLLSHLGEEGLAPAPSAEILSELEKHLKALKLDGKPAGAPSSNGVSTSIRNIAGRVASIVRRI